MENNLKKEFEVYIKYLTTAVCKEIYLEDLKKEVEELQEVLKSYKSVIEKQEEQIRISEKKNRILTVIMIISIANALLGCGILLRLLFM